MGQPFTILLLRNIEIKVFFFKSERLFWFYCYDLWLDRIWKLTSTTSKTYKVHVKQIRPPISLWSWPISRYDGRVLIFFKQIWIQLRQICATLQLKRTGIDRQTHEIRVKEKQSIITRNDGTQKIHTLPELHPTTILARHLF